MQELSHVAAVALEALSDGVIVERGGTLLANPAARRMLELPADAASPFAGTGAEPLDGAPFADGARAAALATGSPQLFRVRARGPDGRERVLDGAVAPFERDGVVWSLRNVTREHERDASERRRIERELVQSGKLAALGELAAGVAHEVNNPLFAMLGIVELLLLDEPEGTKRHERLLLLQRTGLEIREIVRALLDFAREPADEHAVVSLADVSAETLALVRRTTLAKNVELAQERGGGPDLVRGSPNQLKQIFLNLITNAQQAMPEGGRVTVSVRGGRDTVTAVIADDGPGMDEATQARIFEPFFTTKRESGGTGLGLSVSLGIAHMHGGKLSVASAPGRGTIFTLALPAESEARAA